MEIPPELRSYPLADYFLGGYLSGREDAANFPPDEIPGVFARYENVFASALQVLGLTKEALKNRPEFNFDSGDAANLESAIAVLRVTQALRLVNFHGITLVAPRKNMPAADIICEKNGHRVCCEVKAITKQSSGRKGQFLADQLHKKVLESISKARAQLAATAAELGCAVTVFVCVLNWLSHSLCLYDSDYQDIANRLERDHDLSGIDGVLFVTRTGEQRWFLNQRAKSIDC